VKEDSETDSFGSTAPFWGVIPIGHAIEIEERQQGETDEQRYHSQGVHNDTRFGSRVSRAVYRS
jgi:hypothetical protein